MCDVGAGLKTRPYTSHHKSQITNHQYLSLRFRREPVSIHAIFTTGRARSAVWPSANSATEVAAPVHSRRSWARSNYLSKVRPAQSCFRRRPTTAQTFRIFRRARSRYVRRPWRGGAGRHLLLSISEQPVDPERQTRRATRRHQPRGRLFSGDPGICDEGQHPRTAAASCAGRGHRCTVSNFGDPFQSDGAYQSSDVARPNRHQLRLRLALHQVRGRSTG